MLSRTRRFARMLPHRQDSPEARFFKITIALLVGVVLLMIAVAGVTFLLTTRGPEQVLVPDVVGPRGEPSDAISSIVRLQEKGLYAQLQLKHSSVMAKGLVIDQRPRAGAVVKAGRRVVLTVSQGPVVDRVGDYVGRKLAGVRIELRELFPAGEKALIAIRDPVMFVHDASDPGTIVEQTPGPNTDLREGEVVHVALVVSKGPQGILVTTPNVVGVPFADAIGELALLEIPFTFSARATEAAEAAGQIVGQEPPAGAEVAEGTVVLLTMTEPRRLERGKRFGIFTAELVSYPIFVAMQLIERTGEGDRVLISVRHPGGTISWPYVVAAGAEVVLTVNGVEWRR